MSEQKELAALKAEWEQGPVREALSRQKEQKERFQTDSGIEVKALYTPLDLEEIGFDYTRDLGFPGRYPFTRGNNPLGYRQGLWETVQYSGYGDAEVANKRPRFILDKGINILSIALDFPTQLGYDSDHPRAEGEVGKVGVAIDSLQDVEALFKGVRLDKPRLIDGVCDAIGPIWIAMLIALAEKQGVSLENCTFRLGNDILYEYYERGLYIFPPRPSVSLCTDLWAYIAEYHPHWFPNIAMGYCVREVGGNAAQEIAAPIAQTITYLDDAITKGVKPEKVLPQFPILVCCGMDFFEEIAKIRALRRLWARTFQKRYDISDPNLLDICVYVQTLGGSLTAQQPMNNIVRAAIESVAGVLGGCNWLHTCSMDEALATPTEESLKLSIQTQRIIEHETGITQTVDPLAGSYFIESLTAQLERKAEEFLQKIEGMGGVIGAIETDFFQREYANSAYEIKRQIEKEEQVIVGVNKYVEKEEIPFKILKVDPAIEKKQVEKLRALKRERNNSKVREALRRVREAAENHENLVLPLIPAAKAYATIGEICDTLREVYGEYTPRGYF